MGRTWPYHLPPPEEENQRVQREFMNPNRGLDRAAEFIRRGTSRYTTYRVGPTSLT
jgi:hypothetical protein